MRGAHFYWALALLASFGIGLRFLSSDNRWIAGGAFTLGWLCMEAWRMARARSQPAPPASGEVPEARRRALGWLSVGAISLMLGGCAIGFGIVIMVARWFDY